MKTLFMLAALLSFAPAAHAGFKGSVEFSDQEIKTHLSSLKALTDSATQCREDALARQRKFISRYQISAYYGDQSSFALKTVTGPDGKPMRVETTVAERWKSLHDLGYGDLYAKAFIPADPTCTLDKCPNMMLPTSCIGLTMQCLGKGFHDTQQDDVWKRIAAFTDANGVDGMALIDALQKLGWKVYYWTPDVTRLAEWDAQEQKDYPGNPGHAWGYHVESYHSVVTRQMYYFNHVDDYTTMVNFGTGMPAHIKDTPYFVGTAHLGYHVFSGARGNIIEGHSARALTDPATISELPFEPINPNGGPGGGPYHSGIVALPPGY